MPPRPDNPLSTVPAAAEQPRDVRALRVLILGNDTVLAAQPATGVQLMHAGLRAGFDAVVPASWGDELVATACVDELATRRPGPIVFCACPAVAQRLLGVGTELVAFLASFVPPPTALARYLRAVHAPHSVRLTYVGRCAASCGAGFDAAIAPEEFLRLLADAGIAPGAQDDAFDSVVPSDRRRFVSMPGGMPVQAALRTAGVPHAVVQLGTGDLAADLAQHLLSGRAVLVDPAPPLGCACGGWSAAAGEVGVSDPRLVLTELEPPRASAPVVPPPPQPLELTMPLPVATRQPSELLTMLDRDAPLRPAPAGRTEVAVQQEVATDGPAESRSILADMPRRRSPSGGVPVVRPPVGFTPIARGLDGRILPRAYVARRRSGGRPVVEEDPPAAQS